MSEWTFEGMVFRIAPEDHRHMAHMEARYSMPDDSTYWARTLNESAFIDRVRALETEVGRLKAGELERMVAMLEQIARSACEAYAAGGSIVPTKNHLAESLSAKLAELRKEGK